jgi:hypothetical protein
MEDDALSTVDGPIHEMAIPETPLLGLHTTLE